MIEMTNKDKIILFFSRLSTSFWLGALWGLIPSLLWMYALSKPFFNVYLPIILLIAIVAFPLLHFDKSAGKVVMPILLLLCVGAIIKLFV